MNNDRIVLTLDAGGTNFVFTAVRANELIVEPISFPSHADDLERCLQTLIKGFEETMQRIPGSAEAQIESRVQTYMVDHPGTGYRDAMDAVLAAHPDLERHYHRESEGGPQ